MIQAASLFNQLLPHFPRAEFAALVRKHDAERGAKGFSLSGSTHSGICRDLRGAEVTEGHSGATVPIAY